MPRMTDDEAAEQLAKYRNMVWHIAKKACRRFGVRDEEEVASAVQLAFVEAARAFDVSLPCPFGLYARRAGWRAATAACLDELWGGIRAARGDRRGGPWPGRVGLADDRADEPGGVFVAAREDREPGGDQDGWWADSIASLTPHQREVVTLRYRDGLSQNEIAARLGTSQANVWASIVRSLAKLRRREPPGRDRRREVACRLATRGEATSAELAAACGIKRGTIGGVLKHRWFEKAGEGPRSPYRLTAAGAAEWQAEREAVPAPGAVVESGLFAGMPNAGG